MAVKCLRIGADAVIDSGELKGLFTERDLLNRVVAKGLSPQDLRLEEVMTRDPVTVASDSTLVQALKTMFESGIRHLPVMERGRFAGVALVPRNTGRLLDHVGELGGCPQRVEGGLLLSTRPQVPGRSAHANPFPRVRMFDDERIIDNFVQETRPGFFLEALQ